MRLTTDTPTANEANFAVNCFDESSTLNSNGRRSVLRSGRPLLTAVLVLLSASSCWPLPALGQGWDAMFSDYLMTGQEPRPAVARVVAPDGTGTSLGSGVLVDINASQALVLTNWHVVRDSRSAVLVQFPDGFQSAGTVLRVDATWDLAAIVIWKPNVEPVQLSLQAPAIGETLTIAGYGRGPYREVSGGCTQYLSPGSGQPMELVELVGEARQGDSGGPIFNSQGQLAGVLFGESGGRTIGASSPRVRAFLASIGSDGYTAAPPTPASTTPPAVAVGSGASEAANVEAANGPLMTASHRPQVPSSSPADRPLTLAVTPPPNATTAPVNAASRLQPPGAQPPSAPQLAAESPAAAATVGVSEPSGAVEPPAAPAVPPPLEFADVVNMVKSFSPGGNPQALLAVVGAGTLILLGLRGIARSMG